MNLHRRQFSFILPSAGDLSWKTTHFCLVFLLLLSSVVEKTSSEDKYTTEDSSNVNSDISIVTDIDEYITEDPSSTLVEEIDLFNTTDIDTASVAPSVANVMDKNKYIKEEVPSTTDEIEHEIKDFTTVVSSISTEENEYDEKEFSVLPTDQKELSDVPTDQKEFSDVPTDRKIFSVVPTDQKEFSVVPTEQKEVLVVPTNQKEISDVSTERKEFFDVPSDQKEFSDVPSDQKEFSDIPTDRKEFSVVPTDQIEYVKDDFSIKSDKGGQTNKSSINSHSRRSISFAQKLSNYFTVESFTPPVLVFKDPTYMVLSSRYVKPGQSYSLVVNILPPAPSVIVKASIFRDNILLDSNEQLCENFEPQLLKLKVPNSSSFGNYRLKLEGNEMGWLTGTAFTDEAKLIFTHRVSSVAIQTDRPIYKHEDKVKFRILVVDSSAKLVDDSVDVLILTPKGVIVQRWLSRQCLDGAIDLEFALSDDAEEGQWTIRVEASNSIQEKTFLLKSFYQPRFEVRIETPSFLSTSYDVLRGMIYANYTSGAPVSGNVSVRAALKPFHSGALSIFGPQADLIQDKNQFAGVHRFKFRLSDLDYLLNPSEGGEVVVTAVVEDSHLGTTQTAYAITRVFNARIKLKFMGESPHILRPAMPFTFYLTASLQDGSHVPSYRLARHRLLLTPEVHFKSGETRRLYPRSIKMTHDQYGVWDDEIDLFSELDKFENIDDVVSLKLEAELKDSFGKKSFDSLIAVTFHANDQRYVQVTTSSKFLKVGENAIFHVRSNFYLDKFRYIILAKGLIVQAGMETMEASLKTFPVALTSDMAGEACLVVYALERGIRMVVDALTIPVDGFSSEKLKVEVEEIASKKQLKITVKGRRGTTVSLTGTYWDTYKINGVNDFDKHQISDDIAANPRMKQGVFKKKWLSHRGLPDDVIRLPQSSFAADVNQTFSDCGLMVLSDGETPYKGSPCRTTFGFQPCLLGGCFTSSNRCDKKWDCLDRLDEMFCEEEPIKVRENLLSFRMERQSRVKSHLARPWLWNNLLLGADGTATVTVSYTERTANLILSAFGISRNKDITFLSNPVMIKTTPPYWMHVEAPVRTGIWEQVGLKVTVVNQMQVDLEAEFSLTPSPHYEFVSLQEFQKAQPQHHFRGRHPNAVKKRSLKEDHKYTVRIPRGESQSFHLPIVLLETGNVLITVEATFPGLKTMKSLSIFVEPLGAVQEKHTSFLMNLNNRAYLFRFLDVQTPEKRPAQMPDAYVSIFGDSVGGISSSVVKTDELLNLPQMGSESLAFSLLMSLNGLTQWKRQSQQPPKEEKAAFQKLSLVYQSLLSYQNDDGGFQLQRASDSSSVWATALILRCLNDISQDWSHFLYIDPQVADKALSFLISQQAPHGAFWEPSGLMGIRPLESTPTFVLSQLSTRGLNLSTTAITLIQLHNFQQLSQPLDEKLLKSIEKGKHWLEENLRVVQEASKPLEVALVALALHLTKSPEAEKAFKILARNARQEGEQYVYWGEDMVPLPSYRVEENRPFLEPRELHIHDAGNIAATACALRVYAERREILTPAIVKWLQSQRLHHGGWMSTFDTLLAWEALELFSINEDKAKHTRLAVTVEPMVRLSRARVFYITPTNILTLQKHQLGPTLGSVTVQGKGKGSAVLQLNIKYYVTNSQDLIRSPVEAFFLSTDAIASGQNASTLSFHSCVRWLYTTNSGSSGIAVLDVTIPTGYGISQDRLHHYVLSGKVPALKSATFRPRLVSFFFDKIGRTDTCVEFTVDRWFPVANLTTVLPVKIYEYYSPEIFAIELLDMSSITLDICQVCGSYECSNCPVLSYYSSSHANSLRAFSLYLVPIILVTVLHSIRSNLKCFSDVR